MEGEGGSDHSPLMLLATAALLSILAFGVPVTLALDRSCRGAMLLALSFLYGSGVIWAAMLLTSMAGIRWSLLSINGLAVVMTFPLLLFVMAHRGATVEVPERSETQRPIGWIIDILILGGIGFYCRYALSAPVWHWDFWSIWGLKGRIFVEHGGLDLAWLARDWSGFAHPDYPLLLPSQFAYVAEVGGGAWNDRWLALITIAAAFSLLLVVRDFARREFSPVISSATMLVVLPFALTPYLGIAEAPLMAYGTAGVLFAERGLRGDRGALRHAGLLLGLAANTKNEGMALVAVVLFVFIVERLLAHRFVLNELLPLLVAPLLALPWGILRAVNHLQSDLGYELNVERVLARLGRAAELFKALITQLDQPILWACALLAIVIAAPHARRTARFIALAVALQTILYVGAYFVTPHDPLWHIATSWPRLTSQIGPLAMFAVIRVLALTFAGAKESAPYAEARPHL